MRRASLLRAILLLLVLPKCSSQVPPSPFAPPSEGSSASPLPSELIGEFVCSGEAWTSRLRLREDGRYLESWEGRLDRGWKGPASEHVPCDPWGWATFTDRTLTLDNDPATCEELGDPITIPRTRRTLVLQTLDMSGFTTASLVCKRGGG